MTQRYLGLKGHVAYLLICEHADSCQHEEWVPVIDQVYVIGQRDDQTHAAPKKAAVLQTKDKFA